ncbi:immunoglobulin-like domain-containing protein [Clostridium cuniculi]|uniref:immunoglobulin-like domain-containing protein n=1 Tax=Clostridium cuniculi TaxID=2548455 RepID=UPI001054E4B1|nr:immunoglobulin-like domain-containing protein [Clostridium cuniculi]
MKKFTAFSLIFTLFFSNIAYNVIAAVNVGQANAVLQGDYVVIVNTNLENSQSTGSIIFDDSGLNINSISETSSLSEENDNINESSKETVEVLALENDENSVQLNSKITTTYALGDTKKIGQTEATKKTYTLIGIGDKCYVWMENSLKDKYDAANKTELAASEMIKVYEGAPYEMLKELSGDNIPYLDNSGKLSILLETTDGNSGYYGNENDITSIHINTKEPDKFSEGGFDGLNGLLAHEGQHALFRLLTFKGDAVLAHQYSWINEGISVAVMDKLWGYHDNNGWLTRINDSEKLRNGSSLVYSGSRNTTVQDYSMPYLFVRYLAAQATNNGNPIDFLKKLYTMDGTNKTVEQFMNEIIQQIPNLKDKTFKEVLGSFYVAAFSPEKTGEYSFYGDPVVTEKVTSYPIYLGESGKALNLEPTAAIVVKTLGGSFTVPSDAGSDVKFYVVSKNNDIYKPAAGSGTSSDPYVITNVDELNSLGKYPNAYFKLGNDIDVATGSFFTSESFSGNLNGNGYSINNLDKPLIKNNTGTITNLNVNANINMEVSSDFGVIASKNSGAISDVKVNGSLKLKAIVANKFLKATIGGLVGSQDPSGIIERSSFDGNMSISMASNDANVGGVLGYNLGVIENTYSKGSIQVSQTSAGDYPLYLGGLVGFNESFSYGASIETSYSIMTLDSTGVTTQKLGSIVGYLKRGTISDSYGIDKYEPVGSDTSNSDSKKSLTELQSQGTFASWDFDIVWKMDTQGDKTPVFKSGSDINSITAKLSQTDYFVGEKLSLYGFDTLTINGKNITLTSQMLNMDEFDSSSVGQGKVINGSYMGKNFTVTYNIVEPNSVSDLQISEKGKVDYYVGENYSDEGIVLKAKLNGSPYDTYIYSGYTNNLANPLTVNDTKVDISYYGQTVSQDITVKEKTISSITVFNSADKSTYVPGNIVDLSGIRYQINYSDGSTSKTLGYSDLSSYNLKVAQTDSSGGNSSAFDVSKLLEESDNNTKLYIYYGDILPGNQGSISAEVVTLNIVKRLYMEDETFRAAKGNYGYWESTDLLNSNYDVKTTLKSGSLPVGINAYRIPDNSINYFRFDGTPTELGTFEVTYNIAKLDGSDSIDVTFTFNVEEVSNEAKIEKIFLLKSDNKNLPQDIEGTIDDVNNTIKFIVPYGTDITKLIARPTFYKNSTLPSNFIWYGGLDFTTPVAYEVTAEDGKTKKTYMVSVEVLPTPDAITSIDIDNKITDIRVGSAHTFATTVSGFGNFDNSVSWKIEGETSKDTTINSNGTLTIGEDESSKAIKVIAIASGDTSKTIEISINVIQKQQLDKVTELLWDRRLAKWKAILNAKTYELSLYKDDQLIETIVVNTNEYDLTSFIKEAGEYSFTVVAKADGYKDSEVSDRSSVFEVKDEEPTTPTPSKLDKVENLVWNDMVATWDAVANATRYKIALYRNNALVVEKVVDINGQEVLSLAKAANKVSYDFSQYFTTEGEYKFTVVAEADGYESSEIAGEDNNYSDNVNIYVNTRPEITANDVTIKVGESFNERQGVTAYDKEDGDLTNSIEVVENTVVTTTPGVYSVTYKVVDKKGLESTKTIVVTVLSNEKPVISGADDIQIEFGSSFDPKAGVTATDYEDKDLTASIVVTGEVNTSVAGKYELVYSVIDSDKNTTTVKRIVTIKEEIKPEEPEQIADAVIKANNVTIKLGENFNPLEGVEVTDPKNPNIINNLKYTSDVNINKAGVYTVKYEVVGSNGNVVTKTIVVTVLSNEKPVISGANNIQIEFGSVFDPKVGVTATDYEDKDLTASIVVTGEVNTSVAGEYELIYSVTDSDGNITTVKRIVTVKEEVKPENPETPVVPEEPSNPVVPDEPVLPEEPSNPETPVVPEEPELPEDTVKPEEPVTPEVPSVDSDKEDVSITIDNKVETEKNESNSEELPKTGSAVSASELSLLSSLLIFIGSLLSRKKIKK